MGMPIKHWDVYGNPGPDVGFHTALMGARHLISTHMALQAGHNKSLESYHNREADCNKVTVELAYKSLTCNFELK